MLFILPITELVLNYFYERTYSERDRKKIWIIGCMLMWLVIGLRSATTGSDTIQYLYHFHNSMHLEWKEILMHYSKDYGFYYMTKALACIASSDVWFLCATAFLSCVGVWNFIYNNARRPLLALYYYITIANFSFLFSGIRQAIAMSFCLLAVQYAKRKKIIPFVLLVLAGASCHHSALLFLPTYFVLGRRFSWSLFCLEGVGMVAAIFSYERLLTYFNELLDYEYGIEYVANGGIFFAVLAVIILLFLIARGMWTDYDEENAMINMGIVGFMIWALRLISRVAERPSLYWLNAFPVLLTNGVEYYEERSRKFIEIVAIVLCFLLYYRRINDMVYSFFW